MSTVAEIWVRVSADIKSLQAGLAKSSASVNAFGKSTTAAKGQVGQLDKATNAYGKNSAIAWGLATAAVAGFVAKSVSDFIQFESVMVRTVTLAGSTEKQMQALSAEILDVAVGLGKSPQELAEALYFTESAGIATSHAMDVVTVAAKASAIGLGETQVVADSLTSVLNAYGEENITAAKAADILTAAVREGKGEADAIAGALGRVIPIASEMGVSFDQVAGGIAALTQTGLDASEAVTALRGILTGLLNPTNQASEALATIGLSADEVRASIADKGLLPTLLQLQEGFKGNTALMGQVFGNVRALAGVMSLLGGNSKNVQQVFEDVAASGGTVDEAMDRLRQTAEFKLNAAMAAVKVAMIEVGAAAAPIISGLAGVVKIAGPAIPIITALAVAVLLFKGAMVLGHVLSIASTGLAIVMNAAYNAAIAFQVTGSASVAMNAGLGAIGPKATAAAANLAKVSVVLLSIAGLYKVVSGVIGDATQDMDALSKASKVNADLLTYWKQRMDLSGSAADGTRMTLNGFWSSLDGSSDAMEDLNTRMTPLVAELKAMGLSGSAVTTVLASYQAQIEGTNSSITAATDYVAAASQQIGVWSKDLANGAIDLEWYTSLMSRYGLSHKDAVKVANAALDKYGRELDRTGKVVKQFAGMNTEEIDAMAKSFAESMGEMRKQSDLTAGNFAKDTQDMLKVQLAFNADMRKLASDSLSWVPEPYLAYLVERGPGAIHDFVNTNRQGQNQMISDWKRTQETMLNSQGILDRLTAGVKKIEGRHAVNIDVTTTYKSMGHPGPQLPGGGRDNDPGTPWHRGGPVMHAGGIVKRMHGGSRLASDEVPAILQRGEFVLSRRATASIGTRALAAMNAAQGGGGAAQPTSRAAQPAADEQASVAVLEAAFRRALRAERQQLYLDRRKFSRDLDYAVIQDGQW